MTGARVTIVDYGAGNVRSVAKAIEKLGRTPHVTGNPDDVSSAEAIIFPGQGASESAMTTLSERGLVEPLREVIAGGVPFFGVCLGLQLLLDTSEEGPSPCLGVAPGRVRLLPEQVKRPHMGWNRVDLLGDHSVFRGVESGSYFYFVHSYYADPENESLVLGTTEYGLQFCSVLVRDNLVATQFHPEKSGALGLRLYENFLSNMVEA
ncbi:MAG: imidazole glycerol phosphate synthase subunit HisH [Chloroflexota bacterium]|nr:imidazole glycerol phosphate synthase subunit HisH [Chloroflexota bacterium]MDE2941094.1 imidazole glycerol phosphate synthase subunit HisH [Chloroflexota bacterium]MDE3267380.1 imidazole glycerol phosphate synthase subunit HisH [Chloroflexota bacterium]